MNDTRDVSTRSTPEDTRRFRPIYGHRKTESTRQQNRVGCAHDEVSMSASHRLSHGAGRIGTGYELSTPSRMGRRLFPFLRPQPPTMAHPSAISALLLRATLTDDGHCCICMLWLVWYPLPWTRKVGRKRRGDNGLWGDKCRQKLS